MRLFGNYNRIVVATELRQIVDPRWHAQVGINFEDLDIVVHKTRIHFLRGYYETEIAGNDYHQGTIVKIDASGWGPADIRKIHFVNRGQYLYPLILDRQMGHGWGRPIIDAGDMIFQTGEGKRLR